MKGTSVTIAEDGVCTIIEHTATPSLDWLQSQVLGPIEHIAHAQHLTLVNDTHAVSADGVAFCDEEGKLKGRAPNGLANIVWPSSDPIVGPVVFIFGDKEFMEAL